MPKITILLVSLIMNDNYVLWIFNGSAYLFGHVVVIINWLGIDSLIAVIIRIMTILKFLNKQT